MTTLPPCLRTCAPGVRSEGPYEYEEMQNKVVRYEEMQNEVVRYEEMQNEVVGYEEMQDEVVRYEATQERTKSEARMMSWAL